MANTHIRKGETWLEAKNIWIRKGEVWRPATQISSRKNEAWQPGKVYPPVAPTGLTTISSPSQTTSYTSVRLQWAAPTAGATPSKYIVTVNRWTADRASIADSTTVDAGNALTAQIETAQETYYSFTVRAQTAAGVDGAESSVFRWRTGRPQIIVNDIAVWNWINYRHGTVPTNWTATSPQPSDGGYEPQKALNHDENDGWQNVNRYPVITYFGSASNLTGRLLGGNEASGYKPWLDLTAPNKIRVDELWIRHACGVGASFLGDYGFYASFGDQVHSVLNTDGSVRYANGFAYAQGWDPAVVPYPHGDSRGWRLSNQTYWNMGQMELDAGQKFSIRVERFAPFDIAANGTQGYVGNSFGNIRTVWMTMWDWGIERYDPRVSQTQQNSATWT